MRTHPAPVALLQALPGKTSPFGSVFHSFLFSGEKRELTETQTWESEIYIFE